MNFLLDLLDNQNDFNAYFESINKLESLIKLNLLRKKTSIIKIAQFLGLTGLETLDLNKNEIFYFEKKSFVGSGLDNLLELNLNRNQLTEIRYADFYHLLKLKHLYLNFNKIKSNNALSELKYLEVLMIEFNKIKEIVTAP